MKSARVLPGDQTIIELELERFSGIPDPRTHVVLRGDEVVGDDAQLYKNGKPVSAILISGADSQRGLEPPKRKQQAERGPVRGLSCF